ncbi:chemotaxis protein CheW [Desulfofustis limnaeus]|jgi:purine-binding chemotaxis protein CheW|uniref:Chemotaxis protein CheW n=1 Tax=Desulfofustis limnaeus TaxID=2740163 RepID=A0ABM7WBR5_9BACT|nr:chemotaxis protein CheW [Desulfofustis limnaeus]MDX9895371.1 chemotaxis protein CheW [Desulfofustis sp.]BDD88383.1 chemotaxis protein CheW [Desulfofustis limnaeus]
MTTPRPASLPKTLELATFTVGEALCGMDILQIQEINKIMQRTPVPQAPDYVLGVLNLRGKIVTIIDLAKKLGLGDTSASEEARNIIVNSHDGSAGLLVSRIGDVIEVQSDKKEKAPANMRGIEGKYFAGVFKTDTQLIGLLNIDKVLHPDE